MMPTHLTAKNKIVIIAFVWLVASALCFTYFFGILESYNKQSLDTIAKQKRDLALLRVQAESARQAQQDLLKLENKEIHPGDLFSLDVTLVNEIKVLESLKDKYNLEMQLSGISGTINTAPKAKTTTPLAAVSYNINLKGSLPQVVNFVESLENLAFITNVATVSISAATNQVNTNLNANFYLKK